MIQKMSKARGNRESSGSVRAADDASRSIEPQNVRAAASFWDHRDIATLAAMQGVRPHRISARRADFWPEDLDPRDFVALVNAGAADDTGL